LRDRSRTRQIRPYLDIPGLVSEFARWRFWEYQSQSECRSRHRKIRLSSAVRHLYSDEVPEPCPEESRSSWWTTCAELCSTGACSFFTCRISRFAPTRLTVDLEAVHTRIERHGFTELQGDRHVCSVWQRRPEDRVEPPSIITGVGREREVRLADRVIHF
jgi:hypothetical protein